MRSDYNSLQMARLTAFLQVWTTVQHGHDIAVMPPVVLTLEVDGQVLEGSTV